MPTCRDASELVTDYLEGALPLRGWLGLRWHLVQCRSCRRYVAQMRQTIQLLATATFPPPAQATEDSVLDSARNARPGPALGD